MSKSALTDRRIETLRSWPSPTRDLAEEVRRLRRTLNKIVKLFDPGNGVTYDMIADAMCRTAKRALGGDT